MLTGGFGIQRSSGTIADNPLGWKEIHTRVRELRKKLVHLFVKSPNDVTFRRVGASILRCYFLLSPGQGKESTLFFADIHLDSPTSQIRYHEILDSGQSLFLRRVSKEEQLLSERRRISTWGITNYELHPDSGTLVFPASSTVFYCTHPEQPTGPVTAREFPNSKVGLNPRICPSNPNLVAFTAQCDIYLFNTKTGEEKRVTHTRGNNSRLEYEPKSAGVPSYVMQEEFSRYQGYWWQPSSQDGVYRLLYEEIDESDVPIVQFYSPDDASGGIDEFRFSRAGMPNAESTLRMLEIIEGKAGNAYEMQVTARYLKQDLKSLVPSYEYLVRVGWTPDGLQVWCQLLDRKQQQLELILLPLSFFTGSFETHPCYRVLSEHSESWIDVHNILYWWKNTDTSQRMLIWASEESGHRHLYLFIVQLNFISDENCDCAMNEYQGLISVNLIQKVQLTRGEWSVVGNNVWVDEARGLIYFIGLRESPLEKHLYVTSISQTESIQRLTCIGYSHQIFIDDECKIFLSVYSNIETPTSSHVFRIWPCENQPGSDQLVKVSSLGDLVSEQPTEILKELKPLVVPEIFNTCISSGYKIYSMVFRPHYLIAGHKYPTVLHIYGGPQVQLVTNTFKGFRHMRTHLLAAHGFCVISIDSRGSDNRGVKFQSHIHRRMGTVEIDDQIEVLTHLARQCDFIDLNRLAVFGWSYGGYLSLMALAHRPDFFRIAIAGAPVVSWDLYDTGYTERYMGLPVANQEGYRSSSVLSYVKNFPDEENRLLIVQGMIDENVHFSHTNQLIQALVKAGKPYQLQIYPRERHCLRQLESNEHYETKLLSFLMSYL